MLDIIIATKSEIPLIHNLAHQIWPSTFKEILSLKQIDYMLNLMYSADALEKHFEKPNIVYYIAKFNNEFIGFLCIENNIENYKTKIHRIYLLPDAQGKGIGKKLMLHAEHCAVIKNDSIVFLNVNKYNKALEFYKSLEYKIIKEEDIDIGSGYLMEDYVLEKRIR